MKGFFFCSFSFLWCKSCFGWSRRAVASLLTFRRSLKIIYIPDNSVEVRQGFRIKSEVLFRFTINPDVSTNNPITIELSKMIKGIYYRLVGHKITFSVSDV